MAVLPDEESEGGVRGDGAVADCGGRGPRRKDLVGAWEDSLSSHTEQQLEGPVAPPLKGDGIWS